ncbi:tripartite tricarboxylate transporter TctB family protein [Bengtsoniella intestinalis]|uniref:tripartite tricarboxylate transporter TctB family protein n=1 Tax=Bengtsoniella intestinalis TaxID=3073143 RepID=UPI00391F3B5C
MKQRYGLSDIIISLGATALGIWIYWLSQDLLTATLGLGANGWPRIIGILFMLLGVSQTVMVLRGGIKVKKVDFDWKESAPLLLTVGTSLVYVALLKTVGFPIMTPILMFLTMLYFGYRKYVKGIILSIIIPTVIYVLFTNVFYVFLPAGILG